MEFTKVSRTLSYGLLVNQSFQHNIYYQPANPIEGNQVPELKERKQGRQSYDFGAVIGPHSQWQKVTFFPNLPL